MLKQLRIDNVHTNLQQHNHKIYENAYVNMEGQIHLNIFKVLSA